MAPGSSARRDEPERLFVEEGLVLADADQETWAGKGTGDSRRLGDRDRRYLEKRVGPGA
jgi:hypothetical protein